MSNISPISIQQILQMGTATEKLQHTMQHLPHTTGHQQNEERKMADEIKRTSVQTPDNSNPSNIVTPDGRRKKQLQVRKKGASSDDEEDKSARKIIAETKNQGKTIDLMV